MTLVPPKTYHLTPNCKRTFEEVSPRRPLGISPPVVWVWGVWIRNFLASDSDALHGTIFDRAEQVDALDLDGARILERCHGFVHGVSTHATDTDSVHVKDVVVAQHRRFVMDACADGFARTRLIATALAARIGRIRSVLAFHEIHVVDIEELCSHFHAEDMFASRERHIRLDIAEIVEA